MPTTILINPDEVQAQDASRVRRLLDSFVPDLIENKRNAVEIVVTGYDDDPREIFHIPEVRTWFHRLFDAVPELFYWTDMRNGYLLMYALMMHAPVRVDGGTTIRPEDMQTFLMWGYSGLNIFCEAQQLDPALSNQHISSCIKVSLG